MQIDKVIACDGLPEAMFLWPPYLGLTSTREDAAEVYGNDITASV